jgi:hypothetical protein
LKKVEFAVVDDGFWDAVFVEIGEGEDAGFFKGGVFGFQKVEARGFEFFLKGDGIAVFVQLLLDDEVGIFWEVFQVNDDFALGGGVFPCAIGVFAGGVVGGGEVEVAFEVNPADFVGELGGEGLIGFVEGALADEVAGVLGIPGDVPALALEEGLGFGGEAKGFEGGLGDGGFGGGCGKSRANVGVGVPVCPPSTVNRPSSPCGLRSAVGGRQAVSKRLRVRSRASSRGKRDMGNLQRGVFANYNKGGDEFHQTGEPMQFSCSQCIPNPIST